MPDGSSPPAGPEVARQRLDKWLWFARVVKTRSSAARLVAEGHVRVNSVRADAASKAVRPGDVITVALERRVRVFRVLGAGARRGPAPEARTLYEDLAPQGGEATAEGGPDGEAG